MCLLPVLSACVTTPKIFRLGHRFQVKWIATGPVGTTSALDVVEVQSFRDITNYFCVSDVADFSPLAFPGNVPVPVSVCVSLPDKALSNNHNSLKTCRKILRRKGV